MQRDGECIHVLRMAQASDIARCYRRIMTPQELENLTLACVALVT